MDIKDKAMSYAYKKNLSSSERMLIFDFLDYIYNELGEITLTELLTCEDCGARNSFVTRTMCPFEEDVNGREVQITVCNDCYNSRCRDT